jgi:hypothetical protein
LLRLGTWLRLFMGDLLKDQGCLVEDPRLKVATGSKDVPLPIRFQGTGGYWSRSNRALVAIHDVTSKKAPAVTASIKSEPKL